VIILDPAGYIDGFSGKRIHAGKLAEVILEDNRAERISWIAAADLDEDHLAGRGMVDVADRAFDRDIFTDVVFFASAAEMVSASAGAAIRESKTARTNIFIACLHCSLERITGRRIILDQARPSTVNRTGKRCSFIA
jgi:hypothetical protein